MKNENELTKWTIQLLLKVREKFFFQLVFYMLLKVEGKNIVFGTFGGKGSWKKGKKPEIVFK